MTGGKIWIAAMILALPGALSLWAAGYESIHGGYPGDVPFFVIVGIAAVGIAGLSLTRNKFVMVVAFIYSLLMAVLAFLMGSTHPTLAKFVFGCTLAVLEVTAGIIFIWPLTEPSDAKE